MQKKAYIAPTSEIISLNTEAPILAGSVTVDIDTTPEQDDVTFQSFKEQNTTYWD